MQTIDIKGKKWVIGLDWEVLAGNKTIKAEYKEVAITEKKAYAVLLTHGMSESQTSGQGGKFVAIGLTNKPSKYNSAAHLLSLANDAESNSSSDFDYKTDWIVIEELPNDRYWMVAISKSVPLPQTDIILDRRTLVDTVNGLVDVENDTFKIFTTSPDIREIYEAKDVINKGLNELTEGINARTKFKKLTGIPNNVLYATAFGVLVGIAYLGYESYSQSALAQRQQMEVAARAEEEARIKREAYEALLRQYEKDYKIAKEEKIQSVINGLAGNPNKLLNAFYEAVGDLHIGTNGWNFTTINCNFNLMLPDKASCTLNFERTGLSTNRMLLQDYPDANINGNNASVTRAVIASEDTFKVPNKEVLDKLPTAKTWGFDMISQLQLLKIVDVDHKVSGSEEIFFTPPKKPLSEEEKAAAMVEQEPVPQSIGISSGQIELNSNNFVILREVADNIDFNSVGVTNVDFTILKESAPSWVVKMNYFVKNGDGVIGNSDSKTLPASNIKEEKKPQSQVEIRPQM